MNELIIKVNEINNLHHLAINSAKEAVNYANLIGKHLLEAKAKIPHGKFINWIEDNLAISPRQAQRYMQAASGKDLKISDFSNKNDKMSLLSIDEYLDRITMNPVWVPPAGHWFKCIHRNALFAIVPDRLHPEDFHITKFQLVEGSTMNNLEIDWDKELHWTKQPVMASKVEGMLHVFGLDYPETMDWMFMIRAGLDEPMGIADTLPALGEGRSQMSKVTIFANVLRLKGHARTLDLAEKHNCRRIAQEIGGYGGIDGRRTPLNLDLVALNGGSYEEIVMNYLRSKGFDLDHYSFRKSNRGYAVEMVFSVTSGHQCDFNAMYSDSLGWLRGYYPECHIVHAVVHHDEDTPHMHVIVVPILNGRLDADSIRGFKGISKKRNLSLFEFLDERYGLTFPVYLKGAEKKAGAGLAIEHYRKLPEAEIRRLLDEPILKSIYARPEPYLYALGISYEEVLASMKTTLT